MNHWIVSLLFFAYTLLLAYWQKWTATDIVWSMWFASLIGGYVMILCGIFSQAIRSPTSSKNKASWGKSLFLLLFFSIHFIGFHFGHSQIMLTFFPLGDPEPNFGELLELCTQRYWAFILVALLNIWPLLKNNIKADGELHFEEPYKAVTRNHVTIFIVAFANHYGSQQQLLYLLLIVYFFPFGRVREIFAKDSKPDRLHDKQ